MCSRESEVAAGTCEGCRAHGADIVVNSYCGGSIGDSDYHHVAGWDADDRSPQFRIVVE
jgi:hypothetical protein